MGEENLPGQFTHCSNGLRMTVETAYLQDQSDPDQGQYSWAYFILIENIGKDKVQLVNRYWRITDAKGRYQEVFGAGLIGVRPSLAPGENFSYSSGTSLATSSGFMSGSLELVEAESGERVRAETPPFSLDIPADIPDAFH